MNAKEKAPAATGARGECREQTPLAKVYHNEASSDAWLALFATIVSPKNLSINKAILLVNGTSEKVAQARYARRTRRKEG